MRILVFSHGHPAFSKGGAEIAAYNLFQGLKEAGHDTWFFARADNSLLNPGSRLALVTDREFLMAGSAGVEHLTSPVDYWQGHDFVQLLRELQPDVVHLHHYFHLGIEIIRTIRNAVPNAGIVLTLHEYIAICMNHGQMIKTSGQLCYGANPKTCSQCFPQKSPEEFFLRERYIKSFFGLVDHFVSPSEFLKGRYVDWGIADDAIAVIENGLSEGERVSMRALNQGEARGRFAYFGQINPFKGVDLILEAFARLPKTTRKRTSLDIYGSGLESQAPDFRRNVEAKMAQLNDVVRFHGPYEQTDLPKIMAEIDWILMGSVWWENSPIVIQEAFKFGRPIICPDIGGMAEKVQPGRGGLLYRARDCFSLARLIEEAASSQLEDPRPY